MKILYAIQATGNGHISRANEIVPILKKYCKVDLLVSGTSNNIATIEKPKYVLKGLSFSFGKKGGIDYVDTFKKLNSKKFLADVKMLPVEEYDLVLNDFEPVSAWACKLKDLPCIALSHQYAVLQQNVPKPKRIDPIAWAILKYYAPTKAGIGFHFAPYAINILPPVIRQRIRTATVANYGHYTVYLPAYSDEKIITTLKEFTDVKWHIFSKTAKKAYWEKNFFVQPIHDATFCQSLIYCEGIITGGGFETPAEALFLGKKLLSIPMKNQYEQQCNAAALKTLGVPILKKLSKKNMPVIAQWMLQPAPQAIQYKDETEHIIKQIILNHKSLLKPSVMPLKSLAKLQD